MLSAWQQRFQFIAALIGNMLPSNGSWFDPIFSLQAFKQGTETRKSSKANQALPRYGWLQRLLWSLRCRIRFTPSTRLWKELVPMNWRPKAHIHNAVALLPSSLSYAIDGPAVSADECPR